MGQAPPEQSRQNQTAGRKSNAEQGRRLGNALPTVAKLVDQLHPDNNTAMNQK
jgi:hypothetical protein